MATRKGIQLALPFEERRILNEGRFSYKWTPPYLVQPKLNGERCRLLVERDRALLLSSSEDLINCLPHLNEQALYLPVGEYDGELYVHGMSWAEIHSTVSRENNLHPQFARMELHLFDIVTPNIQLERVGKLNQIMKSVPLPSIKQVPNKIAQSLDQLYSLYDEFIAQGYEGFIVRDLYAPYSRKRAGHMLKFKPKQSDSYPIFTFHEAIDESGAPKGLLGAIECIDEMGTHFKVGAGKIPHVERKVLWEQFRDTAIPTPGMHLLVEYQTLSDKEKVPLFARAVRSPITLDAILQNATKESNEPSNYPS